MQLLVVERKSQFSLGISTALQGRPAQNILHVAVVIVIVCVCFKTEKEHEVPWLGSGEELGEGKENDQTILYDKNFK